MSEPSNGGAVAAEEGPVAAGANAVDVALSHRARVAVESARGAKSTQLAGFARGGPAEGLLASLRHHLLAGETHYPDRPGMGELRRRVGAALPSVGFPARDADCVLITQGEGESLFATILGLGGGEGAAIVARAGSRHQHLLNWMRVRVIEPDTDAASGAEAAFHLIEYEEGEATSQDGSASHNPELPQVHAIGERLFAATGDPASHPPRSPQPEAGTSAGSAAALSDAIVIGSLGGLEGMQPFSLGFVAAPKDVRPRIAKWKQASSICSPAPSQRAALWALGVRP